MLQARSANGILITLAALTKAKIEQHRQQQKFYCPACNQQVIMKAGQRTIPHFAHKSAGNCPSREGGEGPYHEKGKLLLYLWLRNQQLDVQLETYLPEIRQRPDIMLTLPGRKVAIEFQCAKMKADEIRKRNAGYREIGVIPVWILGANRFRRQGRHRFQIDAFTLQFIHQFQPEYPPSLFYFCPDTSQFAMIHDIYICRNGQAIGTSFFSKLQQLHFPDIFHGGTFSNAMLFRLWDHEKQKFRLKQRGKQYGKALAWHQWLYLNRTHVEQLPSIIYLPVRSQFRMKTPLWDWQSRFIIDFFHPVPVGGQFSLGDCTRFLHQHISAMYTYPLISNKAHPVEQYLHLLENLQIVKQQPPNVFTKKAPITFHKHIEQALDGDREIMRQLQRNKCLNKSRA